MNSMEEFKTKLLEKGFTGDTDDSLETREKFSHDASLFELLPQLVVSPKDAQDVKKLVQVASEMHKHIPDLSLTARSGGTCMSGGAINDSVIVDFNRYMNTLEEVSSEHARALPGMFYRDFEKETLKYNALMPSFPASRELCTIGGMVANNAGGELSLRYGKTEKYINELKVVFADGNEYGVRLLSRQELDAKKAQQNFEGEIYRKIHELIDAHYDEIQAAKPKVSKNSTGYNLWNVWNREIGTFDLTQLIIGSQGTLGFVTDIDFKLVPEEPYSGVLVAFMKNIDELGKVINKVLEHNPTTFESFDNYTLNLSIKFFPFFRKTLGWKGLIKLGFQLIPDAFLLLRGVPKMILLIEFTGATQEEINSKIKSMHEDLRPFKLEALEDDETAAKAWKFRIMRRESFNLLRKKVKDKHTAPFIDDLVVPPEHLPEFLPRLREVINRYQLLATIAGHMGDGNFHVIPLMKIEEEAERAKLQPAMEEVNKLVLEYGGSLSGEHNDGMIRGPWLEMMYGKEIVDLFRQTKRIFDPNGIFNPHKKTNSDWDYSMKHVRQHF